jgi:glutamate-ammonia-ligase adenylyltransferase
MDTLAAGFLEQLRAGRSDPERLAVSGEPEPGRAAEAFERAAAHTGLAAHLEVWVPELLVGARPGYGAERLLEIVSRLPGGRLDPGGLSSLAKVLAASNFLARTLASRPEWAMELRGQLPGPPSRALPQSDWAAIRSAKYLGLLRVAARDLSGRPFEQSLKELSDLADGCLTAAMRCAVADTGEEAPGLLALGKLGGRELNFSSDVDLLVIYRAGGVEEDRARNPGAAKLAQRLKWGLEEPTAQGFAYRVDFDLRPEGPPGALTNSVSAALDYYESFGAEWERQMLVRLRGVAGDERASRAFADAIVPFVYRRAVGPEALDHVRAMKTRIEEERRRQRLDLDADLKEGPGGIRDVEFLVQALQLFYGGAHPELRTGNVLQALEALRCLDILPEATASALTGQYLWLRRAEHALQLEEERQVHTIPRDPAAQRALARRMGYRDTEAERARERMLDDWTAARTEVRGHFEELVLGRAP